MKGLTRRVEGLICVFVCAYVCLYSPVVCSCRMPVTELWAYHKPTVHQMNDSFTPFITSDKGEHCAWIITASDKNEVVTLTFSQFQIKNSTKKKDGDCVYIYDGKSDSNLVDSICDRHPRSAYTSTQSALRVEYARGEIGGERSFTMTYASKSVLSNEKIIRIAGIIGAVLAVLGLTFIILRATRCCSCLRKKTADDPNSERRSSIRETTRLTTLGGEDAEDGSRASNSDTAQAVPAQAPQVDAHPTIETIQEEREGSDSDSLPDVNELPPSYESLYLNELGEQIAPPNYSPPKHKSSHPPRRVHTIN